MNQKYHCRSWSKHHLKWYALYWSKYMKKTYTLHNLLLFTGSKGLKITFVELVNLHARAHTRTHTHTYIHLGSTGGIRPCKFICFFLVQGRWNEVVLGLHDNPTLQIQGACKNMRACKSSYDVVICINNFITMEINKCQKIYLFYMVKIIMLHNIKSNCQTKITL